MYIFIGGTNERKILEINDETRSDLRNVTVSLPESVRARSSAVCISVQPAQGLFGVSAVLLALTIPQCTGWPNKTMIAG